MPCILVTFWLNLKLGYVHVDPQSLILSSYNLKQLGGIGHVLNEQGTGYEHIFSCWKYSVSIELKMGHII